jgi:hypothetical protein
MNKLKLTVPLLCLSVSACTPVSPACRSVSIPSLPTSVVHEAETSSDIQTELSTLLQEVQQSLGESKQPLKHASDTMKE